MWFVRLLHAFSNLVNLIGYATMRFATHRLIGDV
jgi:hypothetical protein